MTAPDQAPAAPDEIRLLTEYGTPWIVDRAGRGIRPCTASEVRRLVAGGTKAIEFTHWLRDREWWVGCACGPSRIHHPLYNAARLRPNDAAAAPLPGSGCWLCERLERSPGPVPPPAPAFITASGLLLNTRVPTQNSAAIAAYPRSRRFTKMHVQSMYVALRHLVDRAGWACIGRILPEREWWRLLETALDLRPVTVSDRTFTARDITWLPTTGVSLGARAWEVGVNWPEAADRLPEVWAATFIDPHQYRDLGNVIELDWSDASGRVVTLRLSKSTVRVAHCTPPYVALAVGRPVAEGDQWLPAQVVLHGIAGRRCPIPVDSSYEREGVHLLRQLIAERLRVGDRHAWFRKPLVVGPSGRMVDFEAPGWRIYVEIFGMGTPVYREREVLRLTALENAPAYTGWRPAVWRPNDGETLAQFEAKLRALLP